ncbi:MAG: hypothetical protein V3S26_04345 [Acidimicrobiia bacterium]
MRFGEQTGMGHAAKTESKRGPLKALPRLTPQPPVEGLTGDPVIPAGLSDIAGHLLDVVDDRQPMLHKPLLISLSHRFSLSDQRTQM